MDSSSALDLTRVQGGTRPDAPLYIPVAVPDGDAAAALRTAAEASRCKTYAGVGATAGWIVEGPPSGLHELRNKILAIRGLDRVREAIEWKLGERAAPGGLPQLSEAVMKRTEVAEEMPVEAG